ncbi:hypothetical protein CRG98_040291 [Punica granatum]|uniref:DC1 domain-containing protein n=1 Tax=Punica granatum TaxID=22663 RepID=A0A2I0I5N0_PUNGR|nr:hypothetical protein CRG98_040291 [Punica granatum]
MACEECCTGRMYTCMVCRFFLHKSCPQLPDLIVHPSHPDHPLVRSRNCRFKCNNCLIDRGGIPYYCDTCEFYLASGCAFKFEGRLLVHHEIHRHLLEVFEEKEDAGINELECTICHTPCSGTSYGCRICCFFLHKSCADLQEIQHPAHPFHPLKRAQPNNFKCHGCLEDHHDKEESKAFEDLQYKHVKTHGERREIADFFESSDEAFRLLMKRLEDGTPDGYFLYLEKSTGADEYNFVKAGADCWISRVCIPLHQEMLDSMRGTPVLSMTEDTLCVWWCHLRLVRDAGFQVEPLIDNLRRLLESGDKGIEHPDSKIHDLDQRHPKKLSSSTARAGTGPSPESPAPPENSPRQNSLFLVRGVQKTDSTAFLLSSRNGKIGLHLPVPVTNGHRQFKK